MIEMAEKPVKPLFFKYLLAAFGSALVGAVYTRVDMAVIALVIRKTWQDFVPIPMLSSRQLQFFLGKLPIIVRIQLADIHRVAHKRLSVSKVITQIEKK